ncbi:MAG: aldo/keto reductase [Prevotella sp.]|nr:aldo/keto reductase [Prevotella sp.]
MKKISRRVFLKLFGGGALATSAALAACGGKAAGAKDAEDEYKNQVEPPVGKMTYREDPHTKNKISLLGYGMMRLPTMKDTKGGSSDEIDQDMVNKLVDYAIEHSVNYFDTSPAYCQGKSEASTGIALHKYPREKYYVATKLSNFSPTTFSKKASIEMYHNSMKELQVDYIDYYLLHAIGGGGMEALHQRFLDNGMLDFLVAEREAGRIRNLGFSYHGDIEVFDYLLENHDKYKWDFVQIELNYLDWEYANEINPDNTDAKYLYGELEKRGIPAVVMEPLLGGRLSKLPQFLYTRIKQRDPEKSAASWAFRYAGSPEGVLTVLSGMTFMEHLKDNLLSFCPLTPVTEEDKEFLYEVAKEIVGTDNIPCNDCKYCLPCPYGIDIPGIFVHYNKCKNEGRIPLEIMEEEYAKRRREYLIGYDRAVPRMRQADHCIGCAQCVEHCPQSIKIPQELMKISEFVENLRRNPVIKHDEQPQDNTDSES